MEIDIRQLSEAYAHMGEQELLDLGQDYDSLTPQAQEVLRSEFARRKMEPPIIEPVDVPEPAKQDLVTVRRYRDLSEAVVARSLLESAGIEAYLRDENMVRMEWQISNFLAGLRLQVKTADGPAAEELLAQPIPDQISFKPGAEFSQPDCPRCGSTNITFEGANRSVALTSTTLFNLPLPQGIKTWSCSDCGARWENTEDNEPIKR